MLKPGHAPPQPSCDMLAAMTFEMERHDVAIR